MINYFRALVRKLNRWPIDSTTKVRIRNHARSCCATNRAAKLKQISELVPSPADRFNSKTVETVLELYHKSPKNYRANRHLHQFVEGKTHFHWPMESAREYLKKNPNSLVQLSHSLNGIERISSFGAETHRSRPLPQLQDFWDFEQQQQPVPGPLDVVAEGAVPADVVEFRSKTDDMVREVLKIYLFIRKNEHLHGRKLKDGVVQIPINELGMDVAPVRQKNIARRSVGYYRQVLKKYPPISLRSEKLFEDVVERRIELPISNDAELLKKYRRAYKKVLKRSYTFDGKGYYRMNKYFHLQTVPGDEILFS